MTNDILARAALVALAMPLSAMSLSAQDSAVVARDTEAATVIDELAVADMQADFDILRGALEEAHGGLYRFSTKQELDRHFDAYRRRINHPMTRIAFISLVSETLAAIRDGHMSMQYDEATTAALASARLFPLGVRIEGSRLMVISNDTPNDSTIHPGMEVVRINDRTATDVLSLILPKLSGDGFIETGKRWRLGRSFARNYWLFVDQASEFTVTARHDTGPTVTTTLAGVRNADRNGNSNQVNRLMAANLARLDGPEDRVSLQFVADPDIARLRIRGFGGQRFQALIETAFRTLHDKGTRVLILDLRGNGGGVDEYGALLVSQFTDRPFRYFDRIHLQTIDPSFKTWRPQTYENLRADTEPDPAGGHLVTSRGHPGVAEQQPATVPFQGKVFVLIDGGTFSTAADVTAQLHHLKRAEFVGEETGGTYEGNTSGLNAVVALPHSALRVKIMMYGYWNAVESDGRGRGTQPDYPVERRVADLLSGVDTQSERTIALARASLSRSPN